MNVVFSCHIVLPEELQVNSFDLTVILGNLLDNALNALKEAKVKQLNIDINYSIGMIVIKIENTFANISNKYDDPEKHGYGLISVRTSLEKYNGKLQNNIVDDKYVVKAVLYNVVKKSKKIWQCRYGHCFFCTQKHHNSYHCFTFVYVNMI